MTDFVTLLAQGNAWLFAPSAVLLGALHGLEPGHSKTMMAAFIVAVRGTVMQAILLGLSATLSHTAIVWFVAMVGLYLGRNWNATHTEPYLQMASAVLICGIAIWMAWRTWKQQHDHGHGHGHGHDHDHDHDHDHGHGHTHLHDHSLDHGHAHAASNAQTLGQWLPEDGQDAHARAHAKEIRERFSNRHVTTGQIVLFGLTGGLIPCPASITVLLLCLQLKQIVLGATLVLCFSVGLALTMVASGVVAALGVKHISQRWNGFGALANKAPYFAAGVSMLIGLYLGYQGWQGLQTLPTLG